MTAKMAQNAKSKATSIDCNDLAWLAAFNQKMRADWFIDLGEAGLSEEEALHYRDPGQTPESFVQWYAEKYDLIRFESLEDFTL